MVFCFIIGTNIENSLKVEGEVDISIMKLKKLIFEERECFQRQKF